ncbi:MAG: hypothetical protein K1X81_06240 [Bacteroidia bacterium]|nr:hypothetical protein [Bacteroidia bacterium]
MKFFSFVSLSVLLISCGPGEPKSLHTTPDFDPLISPVKEYVQQVESSGDLKSKTVPLSEVNTTGSYTGYFKNGQLVKFIADGTKTDGKKYWTFYLQNNQLVLAHIKETSKNCHGNKFCAWEIKNYFLNGHLIKSLKRGDAFMSEKEANVEEKKFVQNMDEDLMQMDTTQQQYAAYVAGLFNQLKK